MEPPSCHRDKVESAVLLITAEERIRNRTRDRDSARQIVVAQAIVSAGGGTASSAFIDAHLVGSWDSERYSHLVFGSH